MTDGNMNKEGSSNYSQFRIDTTFKPVENSEYISDSVKLLKDIKPDEGHEMRIGKLGRSLLSPEDDPNTEREAYERTNYSINEERARMDAELQRMMNAEFPADIAPMLEAIRLNMNTDMEPAVDKYSRDLSIAFKRSRIFSYDHAYLMDPDQLIVVKKSNRREPGVIHKNGRLDQNSKPRVDGFSAFVDIVSEEIPEIKRELIVNEEGARTGEIKITDTGKKITITREEVNYLSDEERKTLSRTFLKMVEQGIVVEKVYNHANILWSMKDSLETMFKTISMKGITKSNFDIQNLFSAEEITDIGTSREGEMRVGMERDKATRLLEIVGHCETKEKIENIFNTTFILESILDDKTQNRVLGIMKESGKIDDDTFKTLRKQNFDPIVHIEKDQKIDDKYKKVVEFLIGKNITITRDGRGVMQYKLGEGWLTGEQRDPSKKDVRLPDMYEPDPIKDDKKTPKTQKEIIDERTAKKGKKGTETEKDIRGWLTKGNVYLGTRDDMNALLNKISIITGSSLSTMEAYRNFYWWGEADWLAAENYAPDTIPNGKTLAENRSKMSAKEWAEYTKEISSYIQKGGSPNATDKGKIFWADLWRLSDMVSSDQGRPAGQYVTIGEAPHVAQGLMGLVRSEVVRNGRSTIRSVREQMLGSKDLTLGIEEPIKLGDMNWSQIGGPPEVLTELLDEKIGEIDWSSSELTSSQKEMINSYKQGNRADLIKAVNALVNTNTESIGAGAEDFYWLMGFLVADENEKKRWLAAINNPEFKPDNLMTEAGFLAINKFTDITQGAQGEYDGYIEAEKQAIKNGISLKEQVRNNSKKRVEKLNKVFYKGIRGSSQYKSWYRKPYEYYTSAGTKVNTSFGEYMDSLAISYNFLDQNEARIPLNKIPSLDIKLA